MDLFAKYMKDVEALKLEIPKIAKDIIIEHKDVIIGLLQGQLGVGQDKFGNRLEFAQRIEEREVYGFGLYSESTEKYWASHSPFPIRSKRESQPYNFQWTGETFEMMEVNILDDETFEVMSKTSKFEFLKTLYTDEAFELSEEHNDMINQQMILPLLEEKLAIRLGEII